MGITIPEQQFEHLKLIHIDDTNWHLVPLFDGDTKAATIRNRSDVAVSVVCIPADRNVAESEVDAYLEENWINPPEIGGLFYEISTAEDERMYIKASAVPATVAVRIYGTLDPTEDLQSVSSELSKTIDRLNQHIRTTSGNPHEVTKEEVGLGNIPNAITNDVNDPGYDDETSKNVLTTLSALRGVNEDLQAHKNITSGNPHNVTKEEVGLGEVENWPPATNEDVKDVNKDDVYMTPATVNEMIKNIVIVACTPKPQMVVKGLTANRPAGWSLNDISLPPAYLLKSGDRQVTIKKGLQVTYAYKGMSRFSKELGADATLNFDPVTHDGFWYVYANMNEQREISSFGCTDKRPVSDSAIDTTEGDFYNYALCEMRTSAGDEIYRTYIGKVYCTDNGIVSVTAVPFGNRTIIPVEANIGLGQSAILINPFVDPVRTTAIVLYNNKWGETGWNDQAGVLAHPRPGYEQDNITVQVGLVGYLARGSSSGTALGSEFITVIEQPKIAVIVEKLY